VKGEVSCIFTESSSLITFTIVPSKIDPPLGDFFELVGCGDKNTVTADNLRCHTPDFRTVTSASQLLTVTFSIQYYSHTYNLPTIYSSLPIGDKRNTSIWTSLARFVFSLAEMYFFSAGLTKAKEYQNVNLVCAEFSFKYKLNQTDIK